jgi:hypothetical protein
MCCAAAGNGILWKSEMDSEEQEVIDEYGGAEF